MCYSKVFLSMFLQWSGGALLARCALLLCLIRWCTLLLSSALSRVRFLYQMFGFDFECISFQPVSFRPMSKHMKGLQNCVHISSGNVDIELHRNKYCWLNVSMFFANADADSASHFETRLSDYGMVAISWSSWFDCLYGESVNPHSNTLRMFSMA